MNRIVVAGLAAASLAAAAWGCADSNLRRAGDPPPSQLALDATRGATNGGNYAAAPVWDQGGVSITAQKVEFDGDDTLEFRLMVVNKTGRTLVIDRNQIVLLTPDGSSTGRDAGMFGLGAIEPIHSLPPGTSHDVQLEYKVKTPPPDAALRLVGVLVDGKPLPLPDYIVARK